MITGEPKNEISCDMPFFRMTEQGTGTTGTLKVKKAYFTGLLKTVQAVPSFHK